MGLVGGCPGCWKQILQQRGVGIGHPMYGDLHAHGNHLVHDRFGRLGVLVAVGSAPMESVSYLVLVLDDFAKTLKMPPKVFVEVNIAICG